MYSNSCMLGWPTKLDKMAPSAPDHVRRKNIRKECIAWCHTQKKVTSRKEKCYVLDVVMGTIRHIRLNKTLTSFSFSPNLPSKTIKVIQTQINIINGPLLPTQPYYIMTAITNTVFQKHGKPLFFYNIFKDWFAIESAIVFTRFKSNHCLVMSVPQSVTQSVMPWVCCAFGNLSKTEYFGKWG